MRHKSKYRHSAISQSESRSHYPQATNRTNMPSIRSQILLRLSVSVGRVGAFCQRYPSILVRAVACCMISHRRLQKDHRHIGRKLVEGRLLKNPLNEPSPPFGGKDLEFPEWSGHLPAPSRMPVNQWLAYCRSNLPKIRKQPGYHESRLQDGIAVEFVL